MKPITESMRRLVEAERRAKRCHLTRKRKPRKKGKRSKISYTRVLDRMQERRRIRKLANYSAC